MQVHSGMFDGFGFFPCGGFRLHERSERSGSR